MSAACVPPPPVPPDTIELEEERTFAEFGSEWEVDFYRNSSYRCGLDGDFTFVVIEPRDDPGAEAPLWIYLHGGGIGYYDDSGHYVGDVEHNEEESLEDLVRSVWSGANTTLARRLAEGYRLLVPSMCDHDLHSGEGTEYPNNPNYGTEGDTVDGLLANTDALEYVVEHYSTTNVFAHGTSAGSVGVFSLAFSLHEQGTDLNGIVMDSYLITPRLLPLFEAGVTPQNRHDGFDPDAVVAKIGRFADLDLPFHPEVQVAAGFRAVPMLDIAGELDPHCAGNLPPVPGVEPFDNNCEFVHAGFAAAVAAQPDSPHRSVVIEGADHSPTRDVGGTTHDEVDAWLAGILADAPPYPFG